MPIGYSGNSITKEARAKDGGGFESAIEVEAPVGSTFTITGSGFGTKSDDTFFAGGPSGAIESQPIGNAGNVDGWLLDNGYQQKEVVEDPVRGKVWYGLGSEIGSGAATNIDFRRDLGRGIAPGEKLMLSWWNKINVPADVFQQKILRVDTINTVVDGGTQFCAFSWHNANDKPLFVRVGDTNSSDDTTTREYAGDAHFPANNETWCRIDFFVTMGSAGNYDGAWSWRKYESGAFNILMDNDAVKFSNDPADYRWFIWQNYFGNYQGQTGRAQCWMDDLYISVGSNGHKRVELCDTENYSIRTFTQIQGHTSWSDSEVSGEINKDGVSAGTYYLHVVDRDTSLGSKQVEIT